MFVQVPRIEYEKLADDHKGEPSETVRVRVEEARDIQRKRFAGTRIHCNAKMSPSQVKLFCQVESEAQQLLKAAMQQLALSARAFHRVLKLARTIADLAKEPTIHVSH